MTNQYIKITLGIVAAVCISVMPVAAQAVDNGKTAHAGSCEIKDFAQQGVRADHTENFCIIGSIPVGKRWVIEHAALRCTFHAYSGTTVPVVLSSRLGLAINTGNSQDLPVFPFLDAQQNTGVDGSGLPTRVYFASMSGRYYSDIAPSITIERYPGVLANLSCNFSVSGYLIDK